MHGRPRHPLAVLPAALSRAVRRHAEPAEPEALLSMQCISWRALDGQPEGRREQQRAWAGAGDAVV
eukprot:404158-Prymnesium_polylepis.1